MRKWKIRYMVTDSWSYHTTEHELVINAADSRDALDYWKDVKDKNILYGSDELELISITEIIDRGRLIMDTTRYLIEGG